MGDVNDPSESLSALPSTAARAIAFVQCEGSCATPQGLGILIGAVLTAAGTAIVAVLALRALGEWRELAEKK